MSTAPLINLAYASSVKSSFTLMSKQGHFSDIFTIIALNKNLNLLAEVKHDVRPLMCLFIRIFCFFGNWGGRDRTCDLDVNSIPLLPLSYTPLFYVKYSLLRYLRAFSIPSILSPSLPIPTLQLSHIKPRIVSVP